MTSMDPALAAALAAARPLYFAWAEIVLPSATLRLLDGSAEVAMRGGTFVGRDPVYGVLDSIKGLSDSIGDSAPGVTLGLIPANDTALAALLDPAVQGSPVSLGIGVLNMATGLPIGEPYVLFTGELDVPTVKWSDNDRRLDWSVVSIGERLFQIEEGRRLSDAFHQKVWPGELGLGFVTDVETWVPWGQALDTGGVETRTNLPGLGAITGART
mgnify:CR=1 FL=1